MSDVAAIAARHGMPLDAATHLLDALSRGGGWMAQFNHPALGGMGQWHAGGMTMIGDMFNDGLKAKVAALCAELVPLATARDAEGSSAAGNWWPDDLGAPASAGSQNGVRYAVFPNKQRLAIERDGVVKLYNTGDHRIGGVSQQQGSGSDLSFTSQLGPVHLPALAAVDGPDHPLERSAPSSQASPSQEGRPARGAPRSADGGDVLGTLERLAALHAKGILSDEEFSAKKTELLARL